ncbi:MAG TPA: hypothetical protein VFJ67_03440 [Thermodesulfobacteriota bacterium]|nr:hypothetical protein [Thermodesulfobacteriota bacterium]
MAKEPKKGETRYRFFIDKSGNWFQDGIKIRHRGTYLYNNRLLDVDREGQFFIDEGSGRLYAEVEDAPFVVKMVHRRGGEFYLRLNDETEEALDFGSLRMSGENVPYAMVKNGRFEARFLRPAYYELMKYADKDGSDYFIETGGVKHYIKRT